MVGRGGHRWFLWDGLEWRTAFGLEGGGLLWKICVWAVGLWAVVGASILSLLLLPLSLAQVNTHRRRLIIILHRPYLDSTRSYSLLVCLILYCVFLVHDLESQEFFVGEHLFLDGLYFKIGLIPFIPFKQILNHQLSKLI